MATKYIYLAGGREVEFVDEADAYKPEDIRTHWAQTFPELSSASWDEKKAEDGTRVVTFAKKVGTKGADDIVDFLDFAKGMKGTNKDRGLTLANAPAWISTAERLPEEEEGPVLAYVVSNHDGDGEIYFGLYIKNWGWVEASSEGMDAPNLEIGGWWSVTHWMPLPPHPAEPDFDDFANARPGGVMSE